MITPTLYHGYLVQPIITRCKPPNIYSRVETRDGKPVHTCKKFNSVSESMLDAMRWIDNFLRIETAHEHDQDQEQPDDNLPPAP